MPLAGRPMVEWSIAALRAAPCVRSIVVACPPGHVHELAEVVRNLAIREMEKGLSTGEKQMYTRAKKILASEFMYALDKDEEGAEEYLDGLLEERFAATA